VDAIRSKKPSSSGVAAEAYKALFEKLGLGRLSALMKDEDTSIALQAAWEHYKKVVKRRVPLEARTDWILDRDKLKASSTFTRRGWRPSRRTGGRRRC